MDAADLIPRLLRPLATPAVALLWGGLATSALGDQLFTVVLGWVGVQLLGTAAGYLGALQAGVTLLIALVAGAWADGIEHRRMMIGADLARAGALAALVVAWLALGHPSAAMLFGCVLVLAAGEACFRPALQAVLPALVDDVAILPATNALLDTTGRIARLLGPGLIGVASGLLPLVHFVTFDAASFFVSALAVLAITRLRPPAPVAGRVGLRAGIARGFVAAGGQPLLRFMLPAVAIINGTWYAALFLGLPLAIARTGVTAPGGDGLAAYGLVISGYGATNLLATLVIGSRPLARHPGRMIFAGNLVLGTGIALLGAAVLVVPPAHLLPCLIAAAAIGAVGGPMHDITMATLRQTMLPMADMAAGVRAYMVMTQAGALAAMLAAPTVFNIVGIAPTILLSAAGLAATALVGLVRFGGWSPTAPGR